MNSARRVVVTGLGIVSPLGVTLETYWRNLLQGESGIRPIERFDVEAFPTKIAGLVHDDWNPEVYIDRKNLRHLDPFSQYGHVAAHDAISDAGFLKPNDNGAPPAEWEDHQRFIDPGKVDPVRFGAIVGSGIGGLSEIEKQMQILMEKGARRVSPFLIPAIMLNACSGGVAIRYGLKGPNYSTASACAAGAHAIATAFRHIKYGDAEVMLAGATEATVTPLALAGFCQARAMSTRNDEPQRASRPFDKDRDGFIMGEGAGLIVLEEYEHAKKRGARIYCEMVGTGATDDATHITAPDPEGDGARRAMEMAIAESGLDKEAFAYINAHGTSTLLNDKMETQAVKSVFGEHAKGGKLCVSSTKSMTGHLLGASGGIEFVATALSIHNQKVHPTANLEEPGEGCDLDYIQEGARDWDVPAALSNSFGFGGHNACLALKRYE